MPRDIGNGVIAETVADLIGDTSEFEEVEAALVMPVLEATPACPPPGIHFGIPEEDYHAIPAYGKSHMVNFECSPTQFWAESWLNSDRKERDAEHYRVGKAYHAMILEGHEAYTSRFYPLPDPKDYPKALRSVDEIKQELLRQHQTPVAKVDVPEKPGTTRAAKKEDWVAQLMAYDRSALVWDDIVAKAEKIAAGRIMLSADDDRRIRIAAKLIAMDAQLAKAFTGGYPEVTLIWDDPRTGVRCKCRVDYLKIKAVVDLKSFANSRDRSVRNAILYAIASNHYALQPAVYLEGVDEVRKLVRYHGADAVHHHGFDPDKDLTAEQQEANYQALQFALKWASNTTPDRWLWVFQQKGDAPVTRGFWHPLGGTTHSVAQSVWRDSLRKFRVHAEVYGNGVWLDLAEIDDISDEEIPAWGLVI